MKNLSFLLDALSMDLKEKQKKELHQSLVREIIRMRIQDRDKAHRWLNGYLNSADKWVKGFNELHPESTLNADIIDQWKKGSRGRPGEWYD